MGEISIRKFKNTDQINVTDFILNIQNGEFGLNFLPEEQPDLLAINSFYKNGGFWVCEIDGSICGTIALQRLNTDTGILRKMFVKKEYRGKQYNIAQLLFDELSDHAQRLEISQIYLDSPSIAHASHKFYERNGFIELSKEYQLPDGYQYPDRNSKLFKLDL